MQQHDVEVSQGRPIEIPTPGDMEARGAADGKADRAAGLYGDGYAEVAVANVRTIQPAYGHRHRQAAAMTVAKHHGTVADAVSAVRSRSNELAAAQAKCSEAKAGHTKAKDALDNFETRVISLGDPDFATRPDTEPTRTSPPSGTGPLSSAGDGNVAESATSEAAADPAERGLYAWRFALRRDMLPAVVIVLLVIIAGAEFALNARAFQSVREQEPLVLLLAALVGVGMVALCHRIGSNTRDVLDIPTGATGRSSAKLIEIAIEVPALFGGIAGVASIRAAYFSIVGIRIPTFGLVCLQLALAVAAVATSMAGRNQAADERRDRGRNVEDSAHALRAPTKALTEAQNALAIAERGLRFALQALVSDYEVQVSEVAVLFIEHYAGAYATAAGVKLTPELPEVEKPALVLQAEAWLREHELGTDAYLELPFTLEKATGQALSPPPPVTLSVTDQGGEKAA